MKELTIETANRLRNKYMWWILVCFLFIYFPIILTPEGNCEPRLYIPLAICFVATLGLFVGLFKYFRVIAAIKRDPELKSALENEIFKVYQRKALTVGFYTLIGLLGILGPVSRVVAIPADTAFMALFLIGIMAYCVSWLLYNRQ
ncbi:MAG: hypothetical protein LUE10_09435 [Alistipes sp.]|nr:hypothetical protein [Alistipes sp.]